MNYFQQTGYISNSDLTALKGRLNLEEERDLSKAYLIGSLVDALLTEEAEVERYRAQATENDVRLATLMAQVAKSDPSISLYLAACKKQYEFYRKQFPLTYNGYAITIPVRIKLDLYYLPGSLGGDIKTTACDTYEKFLASIFAFDYDRQAAWYMDIAKLERFIFLGISKKRNKLTGRHEVFKFTIQKGDENYNRGRRKYEFLSFNYFFLIHNLKAWAKVNFR